MGIEKHIQVTGTSSVSWKDAIIKTIEEVAQTINYISSVKIVEQRAKVSQDKMTEYYVDIDIAFMVDSNR